MSAEGRGSLLRAWLDFDAGRKLAALTESAARNTAIVRLPDVMGGRGGNRLVCLPPTGLDEPGGHVRVLR